MFLSESVFTLPRVPGILIFRDDSNENAFYAVAEHPRIAHAADGSPDFQLMLYGKRLGNHFECSGGVLSVTVSLGLTQEEQHNLKKALAQDPANGVPQPVVSGLHWTSAKTSLTGPAGISNTTQPSLIGDNRASFSLRLTAEQAKLAQEGRLSATIRYDTQLGLGLASTPMTFEGNLKLSGTDYETRTSRVEL